MHKSFTYSLWPCFDQLNNQREDRSDVPENGNPTSQLVEIYPA